MPLLISFANQFYSPELSLGLYDNNGGGFDWIVPEGRPIIAQGAAGITREGDRIYVSYQRSGLLVYDLNFRVIQVYEFKRVVDAHTSIIYDGDLLVVSSGTDEIFRLNLNENGIVTGEELYWKNSHAIYEGIDENHVNSIIATPEGTLYATCFGKKHVNGWGSSLEGMLIDIGTDKVVMTGLHNPHSAFILNGEIIVCESLSGRLIGTNGTIRDIGGYLRGVCETDQHIVVASSARRRWSKSKKEIVNIHANSGCGNSEESFLYFLDKDTLRIADMVMLTCYGREIFELEWLPYSPRPQYSEKRDAKDVKIRTLEDELIVYADKLNCLTAKNEQLYNSNEALGRQVRDVYGSYSYKIGNAIVRPVSRLLSFIRRTGVDESVASNKDERI